MLISKQLEHNLNTAQYFLEFRLQRTNEEIKKFNVGLIMINKWNKLDPKEILKLIEKV